VSGALAGGGASTLGLTGGIVVGIVVGVVAAVLFGMVQRRRLDAVAGRVASWIDDDPTAPRPAIPPDRDPNWHRLGRSLNALGSDYERLRELATREPTGRRRLVESLAGPALLFGADGALVAHNAAADALFQISPAGSTSAVQVFGSAVLAAAVSDVVAGEGTRQVTAEVGDRYVTAAVSRLDDEVLVIAADRTEERRVEEVRRNFVVNASHELKTPVTAIQALIEALEVTAGRRPEDVGPLVQRLGGEAGRLANLVNDLLDLRRLEDTGPIDRVDVDLRRLADDIANELADTAAEGHVAVTVSGAGRAVVSGNRDDLGLALRNLVSNAIRYNRRGGRVSIEIADDVDGGCLVTIADTGIGIPRSDLRRIFERFYRVEAARSRRTGGTGLGLSIVRHVIERHGGSISVDSLLGQGTTFTVWLPKAPQN
jgi:two-component system phosphate regulon sensor histidine kinase PhoR